MSSPRSSSSSTDPNSRSRRTRQHDEGKYKSYFCVQLHHVVCLVHEKFFYLFNHRKASQGGGELHESAQTDAWTDIWLHRRVSSASHDKLCQTADPHCRSSSRETSTDHVSVNRDAVVVAEVMQQTHRLQNVKPPPQKKTTLTRVWLVRVRYFSSASERRFVLENQMN